MPEIISTQRPMGAAAPPARVLHVLGSLERGGVETWLLNLLEPLDRRLWRFDFCTLGPTSGRYASLARSRGSRVIPCPIGQGRGPLELAGFCRRLYRILKEGGYRVVHSHVHRFSGFVLGVAQAAGAPVRIAHSHNTADGAADTWGRQLYRAASARALAGSATLNLACSTDAARALFGGRFDVVHYGLNGSLQAPPSAPALRSQLGLPKGAPVVGHVGRFHRQKNHAFLIELAAALSARRPDVHWLLVGDGPLRGEVEQHAERLGLAGRVLFAGQREDIDALLASAVDVFVLPSLHEGLPLALLEAQAAGLRSIVSSRVTTEAAVVEGAVEFLPLEAGPWIWTDHLIAALERGRMNAAAARAELLSRGFGIDRSLEDLLRAYHSALAQQQL